METLDNMAGDHLNLSNETETFTDLVPYIKENVLGAARWQMFYVITGGIFFALFATFSLTMVMAQIGSILMVGGLFLLFITAIIGYLYWQLYQATNAIEKFTVDERVDSFEKLLKSYKNYWRCYGIIMLVTALIVLLAILVNLAS